MYKQFEKNTIFSYVFIILLYVLLGIKLFKASHYQSNFTESVLLGQIFNFQNLSLNFNLSLQFLIIFILGLSQYFIYKNLSFSGRSTLVYQVIFLINTIIALSFDYNFMDIVQLSFVTLFFTTLARTNKEQQTTSMFFDIGFFYGLSLLISMKLLLLLPVMIFSINIFGKNSFRDFWGFLFGLLVPIYLFVTYLYFIDQEQWMLIYLKSMHFFNYEFIHRIEIIAIILIVIKGISAFSVVASYNINTRKFYTVLLSMYLILILFYVFFEYNHSKSFLSLFFIGALYMSALYSSFRKGRMKNILLISGFLLAIIVTFVPI